jgi:hypothetical protein
MTGRRSASATEGEARRMTSIVANRRDVGKVLSPEEQAAYRDAKESVVEARRSAPAYEGRLQIN